MTKKRARLFVDTSGASKPVSKAVKKYVSKKIVQSKPVKEIPFNPGAVGVSTTPVLYTWPMEVASGTGTFLRDGNKIKVRRIEFNYSVYAADSFQVVRVALLHSKSPIASAGNIIGDVYDGWGRTQEAYTVLYDRIHQLQNLLNDSASTQAGGVPYIEVGRYKKSFKKKLHLRYSGTGSTAFDEGYLYVLLISDSTIVTHPSVQMVGRTYFIE